MSSQRSELKEPKSAFKVVSWRRYEAELCQRGSVTLWATDEALAAWSARPRTTPGGQERYSPVVIDMMLLLRELLHLALRETEELLSAVMTHLDLDLPVPDHTTISRRRASFDPRPQLPAGPLHVYLNSDGFEVFDLDDWHRLRVEKCGTGAMREVRISVHRHRRVVVVDAGSATKKPALPSELQPAGAVVDVDPMRERRAQDARTPGALSAGSAGSSMTAPREHASASDPTTRVGDEGRGFLSTPAGGMLADQRGPESVSGDRRDLVQTWLKPPVRGGGLVDRKRLSDLLNEVRRSTITFVKAPAGYGKSTVLAQWYEALQQQDSAVGWFSANHTEYSISKFFHYIVAAIQVSRRAFGGKISALINSIDNFSTDILSSTFVNEVAGWEEDVFLFVDDFHLLSDPGIAKAMAIVLGQPPGNLHIIAASRQALPFDISRLRVHGLLAEVGIDRLRFDKDEAASFLGLSGHNLSAAEIETVVTKTEGWAAGIQLAAISLAQRRSDFFSMISGEHAEIATFLAEDVLRRLPSDTVEFMEKTSILARMNASLCTAVTGHPDARRQIDALERQSLFLFSLDEKRSWYRYHHLFADFLQRRLRDRDPVLLADLHRKASDWFAERGFFEEGVGHAIEAGDHLRAATILEKGCAGMLYAGRPSILVQWSRSIPQSVLREYPRLQLEIAWSILLEWNFADARRIILDAERKVEELGPSRGSAWLDLMRKIIMHRKVMLYLFTDDMKNVEREILGGVETFPEDDPYLRGNLDTNLIYAQRELYRLQDLNRIDARAKQYYDKAGSLFVLVWHESISGPSWFLKGETGRAEQSLRRAMSLAETIEGPNSALEAMPALLLAEILYARNSCEEAAELIARFGREAEKKGFVDHLAAYYTVRAALEFRAGDVEAARETLLLGRQSAERHGFERLRRRVENEGLRQSFMEGDLSKARSIRAEGLADGAKLKPRPGSTSGDETWALTWSRAACAMGDGAAASRVLKLWVAFARDRGAARSEVRFLIALSICLTLSGRDGEAARCMREAVSKATGPRYIRYFIDEGQAAETVLRSLFSDEDEVNDPVETFGRELLAAFTSEAKQWPQRDMGAVPTAREEETITPIEPLNTREREVLSLVGVGLSNKEIARRLGLAEASVKWHLQQVFTKLDVRRRIGAVRRAQKFGML